MILFLLLIGFVIYIFAVLVCGIKDAGAYLRESANKNRKR